MVQQKAEGDWDQKASASLPYKKNQNAPKIPSKGLFFDILYGRL
jgi:hypothetical protein